jgi:hypothetical protein
MQPRRDGVLVKRFDALARLRRYPTTGARRIPRKPLLATSIATAVVGIAVFGIAVNRLYARAGKLDKPEIAIGGADGTPDATGAAINRILLTHEKQFVGGHYINALSTLQFAGGTKTINSLLDELSKVEGAILYVRFSRGAEFVDALPGTGNPLPKPYDCVIEHNAWTDAYSLSVTIYLGDDVKLEDLAIPAIRGQAAAK